MAKTGLPATPPIFSVQAPLTRALGDDWAVEFAPLAWLGQVSSTLPDTLSLSVSIWVWIEPSQFANGDVTVLAFGARPKAIKFIPGGAAEEAFPSIALRDFPPSEVVIKRDRTLDVKIFNTDGEKLLTTGFLSSPLCTSSATPPPNTSFQSGTWNWISFSCLSAKPIAIKDLEFAFPCHAQDLFDNGLPSTIRYSEVQIWTGQAIGFGLRNVRGFFIQPPSGGVFLRTAGLRPRRGSGSQDVRAYPFAQFVFDRSDIMLIGQISKEDRDHPVFTHNYGTRSDLMVYGFDGDFTHQGAILDFFPSPIVAS